MFKMFIVYEVLLFVQSLWGRIHTHQKEKVKTKTSSTSIGSIFVSLDYIVQWMSLNGW